MLHIGCGDSALPGWTNIDVAPYPAVDAVHDVTKELPYHDCRFVFAEHFIEHLALGAGIEFLLGTPLPLQLQTLQLVLRHSGFAEVLRCERHDSSPPELRGLERHEVYPDEPKLPHVLVAEASGVLSAEDRPRLDFFGEFRRDTKAPFHQLQYAALSAVRIGSRLFRRRPVG